MTSVSHLARETFRRKSFSGIFYLICATSVAGLAISLFRWQVVHWLTLFVEPLIELLIWGFYGCSVLITILFAVIAKSRSIGERILPLAMTALSLIIFLLVPFTKLELAADFRVHQNERSEVAKQILANAQIRKLTKPMEPETVNLDSSSQSLSEDGKVMVIRDGNKEMVFFFTFRGILDRYSGFVYSATNAPPGKNDFGGELLEVEPLADHWYWAASH